MTFRFSTRRPRRALATALLALATAGLPNSAHAAGGGDGDHGAGRPFPRVLAVPNGYQPEGIAIGEGPVAYVGSEADGSIYRLDLRTGAGRVLSPAVGTASVGLKTDAYGRLFVAGGGAGDARVIDVRTGRVLAHYRLADSGSYINDVVVAGRDVWFTDSSRPRLYHLRLGRHGELPRTSSAVALAGDYAEHDWPAPLNNNANGIVTTPDGRGLLVVQSNTGLLFRVDPATGGTRRVDTGHLALPFGDGLLRDGRTLYVVLPNVTSTVDRLEVSPDGTTAELVATQASPLFSDDAYGPSVLTTPTTAAFFGSRMYLVDARVTITAPGPGTAYRVVAVHRF